MTSLLQSFNTQNLEDLVRPGSLGKDFHIAPGFFERRLADFCNPPVTGDITFVEEGRKITRTIGDINQSYPYFNLLKNKKRIPTLFIHGIENIEKGLSDTVYALSPEDHWRFSNVSSSISSKDSSIGFHADTMDVIVVQVYGSRSWRLYREENMDQGYVREFRKNNIPPSPLPHLPPDITFELHPGDVLHIPAHWGHEGITTSEEVSFSLSFSWYHFTPYIFLYEAFEKNPGWKELLESEALYESYAPPSLDKQALVRHLAGLFREKDIPVTEEVLLSSINYTLSSLTSTQGVKKTEMAAAW